jgi:hypothetical protein
LGAPVPTKSKKSNINPGETGVILWSHLYFEVLGLTEAVLTDAILTGGFYDPVS